MQHHILLLLAAVAVALAAVARVRAVYCQAQLHLLLGQFIQLLLVLAALVPH
jgi:hypothetical protein